MSGGRHVVTGAFGFSGKHITRRLLAADVPVRTLTNSPNRRHSFGDRVDVHPLCFDDERRLVEALRGAETLYNTYWVRFNHKDFTHVGAVENTRRLFDAARVAGVKRIVHVSITNPSEDSPFEYFSGKAKLEKALRDSGLPHTILRPAVLFGEEDILINNIAWVLRKFPVFGVFGDGSYRIQPIHVDDFAALAVREGGGSGDRVIDAIGPETFTFRELVEKIGAIIGRRRPIVSVPPSLGRLIGSVTGWFVRDVIITREEIGGLMADLLHTDSAPAGETRLTDWAREHRETIGRRYASELGRRRDRQRSYDML
ncbi:MAG: NAD(P)H-binding protein [Planctomycetes bacterium]|nr:NAD(P)H-binding protein [Planctomycetota bacterium]